MTTYRTIRRHGYTGKVCIVVDTTDAEIEFYKNRFGENVLVFDKAESPATDYLINEPMERRVIYARNWVLKDARRRGEVTIACMDDGITGFKAVKEVAGKLQRVNVTDLDTVLCAMAKFLEANECLWACSGLMSNMYFGGAHGQNWKDQWIFPVFGGWYVCRTDRITNFIGDTNEDTVTSYDNWKRGACCMSFACINWTCKEPEGNNVYAYGKEKRTGNARAEAQTLIDAEKMVIVRPDIAKIGSGRKTVNGKNVFMQRIIGKKDYSAPMIIGGHWKK